MKKVFILDDRTERKKQYLSDDDSAKLEDYVTNGNDLIKNNAVSDIDKFSAEIKEYSLIAIHRTWLMEFSLYNEVVEYTARNKKNLIIFSGGIGQTLLLNGEQRLMINASNFYTKDLLPFIEKYCNEEMEHPLLQFLYGDHWRLPLLLQYRHALWLYGDVEDMESLERSIDNYQLIFQRKDIPENTMENEMVWVNKEINKETVNL